MQLKEVMVHTVEVIHPDATLQEAARRMRERDVGAVAVCDGDHLMGMLTDRDITVRAAAEGRDPATSKVRDIMTSEIVSCCEHHDVMEAIRLMREKQLHHVAVFDRHQRVVGIVSLIALAEHIANEQPAGSAIRWPA